MSSFNPPSASAILGVPGGAAELGGDGYILEQELIRPVTFNQQAGTAYTLAASDQGRCVSMANAAANTLTIPAGLTWPVGAICAVRQGGAGTTLVAAAAGVTLVSRGGVYHMGGQYAWAWIVKTATDTYDLMGDIAA